MKNKNNTLADEFSASDDSAEKVSRKTLIQALEDAGTDRISFPKVIGILSDVNLSVDQARAIIIRGYCHQERLKPHKLYKGDVREWKELRLELAAMEVIRDIYIGHLRDNSMNVPEFFKPIDDFVSCLYG